LFVVKLNATAGKHLRHVTHIGFMNCSGSAQVTLVFSGLLGQDVTFESLTALDGATWTNAKTLFSAALGLHFGHFCSFFMVLVRRLQTVCNLDGPETLVSGGFSGLPLLVTNLKFITFRKAGLSSGFAGVLCSNPFF
jgi:hypothetical protein